MPFSKSAVCESKKSKFIKEQEASRLLSSLFLLGDKFMPEMHLNLHVVPGFTYSACGPFTKNKERIQKFKETGDSRYIYQKELDKACFQHHMAHGDFKDITRRTASDQVLRDKAFNIAKNPKYDRYQRGLASAVYKFFDKKTSGGSIKNEIMSNKELAEELHKQLIRKFKERKVYTSFIDNIGGADLADMQSVSKLNKRIRSYYVLLMLSVNLHGLFSKRIVNLFSCDSEKIYLTLTFRKTFIVIC